MIFLFVDVTHIGKCLSTYNQHLEEIPRFPFDRVNMIFERRISRTTAILSFFLEVLEKNRKNN